MNDLPRTSRQAGTGRRRREEDLKTLLPRGFTLTELLVVLAVVLVLALLLPALSSPKYKASRVNCVNNLKQVSTAFRLWANDFGGPEGFNPALVSTNAHGALEPATNGQVFRVFQIMSNDLGTPKILACQSDTRGAAASFGTLSNVNLSYFVGLEASEYNPQMVLTGDRNLALAGRPLPSGIHSLPANVPLTWTRAIHPAAGNVALADGSVQQCVRLPMAPLAGTNSSFTNRLAIP